MRSDHIEKIVILLNKGNFIEVEKQLTQLINTSPKNYTYLNLLSIAYAKQNKIDLSVKILKKIIINNPNFVDAHTNFASIVEKKLEFQEASKLYKYLLKKYPDNIYLLSNYCNKSISSRKFKESTELLKKLNI